MGELVSQLGIDWRLLLAQVVNFLILFWVLKRYAFAPLQKFLQKRSQDIKQGLDDAKRAQEEREELKVLHAQITKKAHQEASVIIEEARKRGSAEHDALMKRAEEKVVALAQKARNELAQEKTKMVEEARKELGAIAMMATQKLLGHRLDEKVDKEFIENALREIK